MRSTMVAFRVVIFACGSTLAQIETHRSLPFLIDMKAHYHLCKMMHKLSYRRWEVQQLLLSQPLV